MIESKSLQKDKDNHRFSAASAKGEIKLNRGKRRIRLFSKVPANTLYDYTKYPPKTV